MKEAIQFTTIDFSKLSVPEIYHLVTSMVVPRPIAVVGTQNENGSDNLAPFSYFNMVSSNPPCLMVSIGKKRDGTKKDTQINIENNKNFVVHLATVQQVNWVEEAGDAIPYGESEREKLGLTLTPSTWIKTPRVKEFKIAFECELYQSIEIGPNTVIFGKILGTHYASELQLPNEKKIDSYLLDPLARMARDYGRTSKI